MLLYRRHRIGTVKSVVDNMDDSSNEKLMSVMIMKGEQDIDIKISLRLTWKEFENVKSGIRKALMEAGFDELGNYIGDDE